MSGQGAFTVGSVPWLMANELRLAWRGLRQDVDSRRRGMVLAGVFGSVTLFFGLPLGVVLRNVNPPASATAMVITDAMLVSVLTLMVSAALASAVEAFYARGDLDLLLGSPTPPRRILIIRAMVIAFNVFAGSAVLISPLFLPIVLIGHLAWAATYLVLGAMALGATAVGLILSMVLLRMIGPRRTRAVAQILAAVIGAAIFLSSQAWFLLTHQQVGLLATLLAHVSGDGPPSALMMVPLRAVTGGASPTAKLLVLGGLVLTLACVWVGDGFADAAAAAAGAGRARRHGHRRAGPFVGGFFLATLVKEWRLMVRDLPLVSDVVLKLLYLLPLSAMAVRGAGTHQDWAMATVVAAMTFMAGQVAGSLAWITLSAEDAPDLLAVSPTPLARARRAKLLAALGPIVLLLAGPVAYLASRSPTAGLAAGVGCACAALAGGLVNDWYQRPARRSEFRRKRNGSFMIGLAEFMIGVMIALTAGAASLSSPLAFAPGLIALIVLGAMSRSDRDIDRVLETVRGMARPSRVGK